MKRKHNTTKAAVEAEPPAKKQRKRTAVTQTTDPQTIAAVKANHTTSPLLRLPFEIRENILRMVLGDKCIHIRLRELDSTRSMINRWDGNKPNGRAPSGAGAFIAKQCHFRTLPPLDVATQGLTQLQHSGSVSHDTNSTRGCSKFDERSLSSKASTSGYRLNMSLLATCRQLYEECHPILWSTNAFVFDDGFTLPSFLTRLNKSQRNRITTIHLRLSITPHETMVNAPSPKSLDQRTVELMHTVQHVAIDIQLFYSRNSLEPKQIEDALARLNHLKFLQFESVFLSLTLVWGRQFSPAKAACEALLSSFREAMLKPANSTKKGSSPVERAIEVSRQKIQRQLRQAQEKTKLQQTHVEKLEAKSVETKQTHQDSMISKPTRFGLWSYEEVAVRQHTAEENHRATKARLKAAKVELEDLKEKEKELVKVTEEKMARVDARADALAKKQKGK